MGELGAQPGKARVQEANAASEPRPGQRVNALSPGGRRHPGWILRTSSWGLTVWTRTCSASHMSCMALSKPRRLSRATFLLRGNVHSVALSSFPRLSYQVSAHVMLKPQKFLTVLGVRNLQSCHRQALLSLETPKKNVPDESLKLRVL